MSKSPSLTLTFLNSPLLADNRPKRPRQKNRRPSNNVQIPLQKGPTTANRPRKSRETRLPAGKALGRFRGRLCRGGSGQGGLCCGH
jgi:hypothetical protein